MRLWREGAEPGVNAASETVAAEQRLEIEREPVGWERGHGVDFVWVEGLLLLLGWGLGEGVYEVGVVRVVVADGRHDGDVAVVRGVVGAGYTRQRTVHVVVWDAMIGGRVESFGVGLVVVVGGGSKVGLLLAEGGDSLRLLWGG